MSRPLNYQSDRNLHLIDKPVNCVVLFIWGAISKSWIQTASEPTGIVHLFFPDLYGEVNIQELKDRCPKSIEDIVLQNKIQLFCSHWKLQKKPQKKTCINILWDSGFGVEVHVCSLERELLVQLMFIICFQFLEFKWNNFKSLSDIQICDVNISKAASAF